MTSDDPVGIDDLSRHIIDVATKLGKYQAGGIGQHIDTVTQAARTGAWLLANAESPKRCKGCGHQPHGDWCPNLASDNDCSCVVVTEP